MSPENPPKNPPAPTKNVEQPSNKNSAECAFYDFRKICSKKINSKIDNIQFLTQTNSTSIDERDRCCSRIWDNHYGTRCNYKKIVNEDYCRHHLNMIQKNGRLVFNRYDEDKPMYNEKNNRIPWFTKPKIDMLNDIIQYQSRQLNKLIFQNLKQRQIAPKF